MSDSFTGGRAPGLTVVLLGVGLIIALAAHAASYLPFIADDALISLRYADRLLTGHGLTWTDGQHLEGYSNLLWVLCCAALGLFGIDLILACRILGIGLSALTVVSVLRAHGSASRSALLAGLAGGAALVLSGPIAVWSVGGLEQPLLACLLAWALVLGFPLVERDPPGRWLAPGLLLALLCWTRPDGILFTAGVCAGVLAARGVSGDSLRLGVRLAVLPAAAVLAQLAFRLAYYGDWIPNSAHAKVGFTITRAREGLAYLGGGLWTHAAIVIPAAALALWCFRRSSRIRLLAPPLLLWSAYVVVIGGDIFPARRHMVPVIVVLALLLAEGIETVTRRGGRAVLAAWIGLPVAALALGLMQHADPENRRARVERWEWDGQVVGNLLRSAFADRQPLMAVDPGGTLPYFSKLPSIDMLGINDRYLARNRPSDFGHGHLGHELGDGDYVLGREPDLIVFCGPAGGARPCFRSGAEIVRDPRLRERYRLAAFEGDDPYRFLSRIWVRTEGGRIGIERDASRIVVPGYLLTANPHSVARLDETGRPSVTVTSAEPAGYVGLMVPDGRWTARAETAGGPARIEARLSGRGRILLPGEGGAAFELSGAGRERLDLLVAPADPAGACRVHEVVLERAGDDDRSAGR